MTFNDFLKTLFAPAGRGPTSRRLLSKARSAFRPRLEALDERIVPVVNAAASYPTTLSPGGGYDDVVQVFSPGGAGSGSLLASGRHVLTAAHVVDANGDGVVDAGTHTIQFDLPGKTIQIPVSQANVTVGPGWNGVFNNGSDIAIIDLGELSPFIGGGREIYRGRAEVGRNMEFVGYGNTNNVNPSTGAVLDGGGGATTGMFGTKRIGFNRIDSIFTAFPPLPNLPNQTDEYLRFDLDMPGNLFTPSVQGEAISAPGDSGGPMLLFNQIAGVSSGGSRPIQFFARADYTRVSSFAGWIDGTVGGQYQLVLDMNNQRVGNDSRPDSIELRRSGSFVDLVVNGQRYLRESLNNISSVTIRGSDDDETLTVDAGLGEFVTFSGKNGKDGLVLQNRSLLNATFTVGEGVAVTKIGSTSTVVSFGTIDGLSVEAGRRDIVNVNGARPEHPVSVFGGASVNHSIRSVNGPVHVSGNVNTTLQVIDNFSTPGEFRISSSSVAVQAGTDAARVVTFQDLGSLTVNGNSSGNTFVVNDTPTMPTILNTGLGVDTVSIRGTTGHLTVNGQDSRIPGRPDGFDTVTVGNNATARFIAAEVVITNVGAYVAVTIDDSDDNVARTGIIYQDGDYHRVNGMTRGGSVAVRSRDIRSLTVLAGSGNNTFRVHSTPASNTPGGATTTLRTGVGSDHVTVNGTTGALVLDSSGGADTTLVGSDSTGLGRILGAVSFTGPQGDSAVTIRDRATYANGALSYTVTATRVTRTAAAPVNLSGVKSLLLQTGRARDTINVLGNPTAGVFSFDIQTGAGDDTVNVGGATNRLVGIGLMTVNGEAGTDTLNLNDQGSVVPTPYTFGVAEYPFFTSPDANVSHANVETAVLNGGSGDDSFLVTATAAGTTTTLNGGDGNDGFIVGDGPGLAGIAGRLRFDGQTGAGGGGYARVNDSVGTQARSYTWDGTSLSWGTVTVGVANLGLVQVIGGQADDAYRVSALGAIPLAIGDAKGNDRLTGPDAATRWNVTGLNAGDLGAAASFASIENLVGGNANDTFVIAAGAGLDGRIDGGAGVNTLDYSAFNGDSLPTPVSFYNAEGDFLDSAGGNHGEGNGDITFNPGRVGQAFDFTGVGDYIDLGNDPSLDLAGSTSVALWVKLDSLDHFKYLFADFAADGVTSQGSLGTTQGQTAFTWYQSYTDGTYQTLTGTTPIRLDQWFHLSVVRDDATKTVRLYVNGVQEASLSYAGRTVVALQGSKLLGGAGPLFPADSIDGQLDEVGIHNRALSPAEIQTIYAGTAQYAPAVLSANGTFSYAVNMAVAADGSIYVANSAQYSRPGIPGGIVRVDPVTGAQTAVTTDGLLHTAVAVAVEADGNLAALDYFNGLVRIDSITGAQLFVSDFRNADQGPVLTYMIGLVVESSGNYLVSDATTSGVYRVDRTTGFRTLVTSGGSLTGLYGLALEPTGQVLAINYGPGDAGSVVRVNPATGAQSVLASGFAILQSIAVASDGSIFVTDAGNYTGTPSRIYRIDPVTGARSIVFTHPPGLRYFSAIAIESNGSLVVSESAGNFGGDFNTFIVRLTPPASPTGVVVNLPLGTATGLTGGIANIQNVVGSSGDDLLVGNGGNVLTGGAGRDVLIAGASPSVLFGGDGDDLLIGGTTDYDRNPDALLAVRAAWSRQDADYATRVANLRNGTNGAPLLNATTVHGNGGGNTLTGGAGRDFFYGSLALDLFDTDPLTEDFEPVFVG